ncbi:DUF6304 family protein [Streptomyces griseorubiginosus]|uniref:DUF6304 family protein n=1 Tax=Streptomyces griseorubiginosus TaxID=67304 RepID=UPI0036EA1789
MTAAQLQHWPGRYTDRHGSEEVVFESDGRELIRTTIRGVRFEGATMDTLGGVGDPLGSGFTCADRGLFACLLEWAQPVPVEVAGQDERIATLHCALRLGHPADREELTVVLRLDGHELRSTRGTSRTPCARSDAACPTRFGSGPAHQGPLPAGRGQAGAAQHLRRPRKQARWLMMPWPNGW